MGFGLRGSRSHKNVTDNNETVVHWLPVELTLGEWKMLGRYLVWLNRDRLKEGRMETGFSGLMATFARLMLVHKGAEAQREFDEILLEAYKRNIPGFFTHDELASIAGASSSELFSLLRIDQKSRRAQQRALQRLGRRSKSAAVRLPQKSGKVRGRSLRVATGLDGWTKEVSRSAARRTTTAR
jgi:hypothetical protein